MLKNLDPLLHADLLQALCAMGHGDELVLCDTNFPADALARETVSGKLLRLDGVDAARATQALLSVLPLDSFVEQPALRMQVVDEPDSITPVQREVQAQVERSEGRARPMGSLQRQAFYDRARRAYCIVASGETRLYGCFIFKKGVIAPNA